MNNKFLKSRIARAVICVSSAGALLAAGIGIGYRMQPKTEPFAQTGYASNPTYEYMVGAAAWQMSAEAHALMMQGFHVAQGNVDDMVALADTNQQGYRWVEEGGQRKLFYEGKQVAVVCDIDDTLVDGVHYGSCTIKKLIIEYHAGGGVTQIGHTASYYRYSKRNNQIFSYSPPIFAYRLS